MRATFAHHGGNLAVTGAVAFQFQHAGQFLIAKNKTTEDRLMEIALDTGADDVIATDDGYEVRCAIPAFDKVLHALDQAGIKTESAELAYIPTNTVPITNATTAQGIVELQEALEENDDVQYVFTNEELDESISAAVHGG